MLRSSKVEPEPAPLDGHAERERLRFGRDASTLPAGLVGIEAEFGVHADGRQVDFAELIADVAAFAARPARRESGRRYRLASGHLLMADGAYAEIATPPEPLGSDAMARLVRSLFGARNALFGMLARLARARGRRYTLTGYSAHLNVASGSFVDGDRLARRIAGTYGPLLAFLTSRPDVLGVVVRPRPGRIELVADYVDRAAPLRAAATALIGCTLAAIDEEVGGARRDLPRLADGAVRPATIRPGWRLTFAALGADGSARARALAVPVAGGGEIGLQALMDCAWSAAAPYLDGVIDTREVRSVARFVRGVRRVAFENGAPSGATLRPGPVRGANTRAVRAFTAALQPRRVAGWRLAPAFTHWDFVAYAARCAPRDCVVTVPRSLLGRYAAGALDGDVARALAAAARGRLRRLPILARATDATALALFAAIDKPALAADLEQATFAAAAERKSPPKKPPGPPRYLCGVVPTEDGYEICQYPALDPLRVLIEQEPARGGWTVGCGVWAHSRAFVHLHTDHVVRGLGFDFAFARHYRSSVDYDGTLGLNWDHGYDIRVIPDLAGDARGVAGGRCDLFARRRRGSGLTYYDGTGRMTRHAFVDWEIRSVRWCEGRFDAIVTTYAQNPGEDFEIERYALLPGSSPPISDPIFYRIRFRGGVCYFLNCHGYVVAIRDRNRNSMLFVYGLPVNPKTAYLVLRWIRDTSGRWYRLDYRIAPSGMPRLVALVEIDGKQRRIDYEYDRTMAVLAKVRLVAGDAGRPEVRYGYRPAGRPGLLETIINPVEAAAAPDHGWLANVYEGPPGDERLVRERVGDPGGDAGGTYRFDAVSQPGRLLVTDRAGVTWTYVVRGGLVRAVRVTDEVSENQQIMPARELVTRFDHDANFHVVFHQEPGGRIHRFRFRNRNRAVTGGDERDRANRRPFTHRNDLSRDDLLWYRIIPAGGGQGFVTRYDTEPLGNQIERIRGPVGVTRLTFDNGRCATPERNGNPMGIRHPPQDQPGGGALAVVETFDYGRGGNVRLRIDPDGVKHEFTLDETTGQISVHLIGGRPRDVYVYDRVGNCVLRQDEKGREWRMSYDARDNLRTVTDPLGHLTTHSYDLNDRLTMTTVIMADDPTTIVGIAPGPSRTLVETSHYNILGARVGLVQTVGATGGRKEWKWELDGEGRVTAVLTPRATAGERPDARIGFRHNARGLVRERIAGEGGGDAASTFFSHDADGALAMITGPLGAVHVVARDGFGRVVAETAPDGAVRHTQYDGPYVWRTWVEGPVSERPGAPPFTRVLSESHYRRDRRHRVIVEREVIFDPSGRTGVAPAANRVPFRNLFARRRFRIRPATVTRIWFTPGGRVRKLGAPGGGVTVKDYRFDDAGQLDHIDLPGGHRVDLVWNGLVLEGKRTTFRPEPGAQTDPAPADLVLEESTIRDALGRVVSATATNGLATQFAYDSLGNLRAEKAPLGVRTHAYDGFSRVVQTEIHRTASPSNLKGKIILTFDHDANDNRILAIDDLGRRTTAEFDGHDRMIKLGRPQLSDAVLRWRADGLLESVELGPDRDILYGYDAAGRHDRIDSHEGIETCVQTFGCDGLGRVTWAFDSNLTGDLDAVQVFRRVDSLGRVTSERTVIPRHGFDKTAGFEHRTDGRRRIVRYPDDEPKVEVDFTVDGNVSRIRRSGSVLLARLSQGPGRTLETAWGLKFFVRQSGLYSTDFVEAWRYDDRGRPDWHTMWVRDALVPGGGLIHVASSEWLTYDPVHGLVGQRRISALAGVPGATAPGEIRFQHDGAGRVLLSRQIAGADVQLFEYDWDGANVLHQVGEVRTQGGTTSRRDRTLDYVDPTAARDRTERGPDGETEWKFDGEGRVVYAEHRPRAGADRDRFRDFSYDPCDRLARVFSAHVPLDFIEGREILFLHDAFGRLVMRQGAGHGETYGRVFFTYDGPLCIAEHGQTAQGEAPRRYRTYVYDSQGALVHYLEQGGPGRVDAVPIVTMDGRPWFVVDRRGRTDSLPPAAGTTVQDRVRYWGENVPLFLEEQRNLPFAEQDADRIVRFDYSQGPVRTSPAPAPLIPTGHGGHRALLDEGLVYNLRRFYDPALRAFITPDPVGAWGDPAALGNSYVYAANSPAMMRDDGNISVFGLFAALVVGGVVGGAYSYARQFVQIWTGGRQHYDHDEAWTAVVIGAALGAGLALLPQAWAATAGGLLLGAGAVTSAYALGTSQGTKSDWAVFAFDAVTALAPLGLPRMKRGFNRAVAEYHVWRLRRTGSEHEYMPWFITRDAAEAVLETALHRDLPWEVGLYRRVERTLLSGSRDQGRGLSGWSPFRYRVKRGEGTSVETKTVGPPQDHHGYQGLAHTHPGTRLLHRLPSGADISSSQALPYPGPGEVWAFRYPNRSRGERGPIVRTRYEVGEWGGPTRITPDHPRDFDQALALLEQRVRWVDPGRTTLAIAPARPGYPNAWSGDLTIKGYNVFFRLMSSMEGI